MAPLRYAAKFDPFLSLDCNPRPPPWRNPRKGRDQILPSGNIARLPLTWLPLFLSSRNLEPTSLTIPVAFCGGRRWRLARRGCLARGGALPRAPGTKRRRLTPAERGFCDVGWRNAFKMQICLENLSQKLTLSGRTSCSFV